MKILMATLLVFTILSGSILASEKEIKFKDGIYYMKGYTSDTSQLVSLNDVTVESLQLVAVDQLMSHGYTQEELGVLSQNHPWNTCLVPSKIKYKQDVGRLVLRLFEWKDAGFTDEEIVSYEKAISGLSDYKPTVTMANAKNWKEKGLSGWDIIAFDKAAVETFGVVHHSPKIIVNTQIYFLKPGFLTASTLSKLMEYKQFRSNNSQKFIDKHVEYIGPQAISLIPDDIGEVQVIVVETDNKERPRYVKLKIVGGDFEFWTVVGAIQ